MYYALTVFFLSIYIAVIPTSIPAQAAFFQWNDNVLLTIDDQEYSKEDFKNWWSNWREENQPFPQTIDPYIDWLLLVREAERMMLYDDPLYHRDINVYLKVLSQVQLKTDEIDSKINITDSMLREEYNTHYSPIWNYHAMVIKDKSIADLLHNALAAGEITVEELLQFIQDLRSSAHGDQSSSEPVRQPSEKLDRFQNLDEQLLEVRLNVSRRPKSGDEVWSDNLQSLEVGSFSKPFAYQDVYVIVQLTGKTEGDEEDFTKIKRSIASKLRKEMQAQLTIDLINRLKEKYNVQVDEQRVRNIDPDSPDKNFSDYPLIRIGDSTITEKQVLDRVERDIQKTRMYGLKKGDTNLVLQKVIHGIISHTLITLESLNRHYEKTSPIKELMEFKQQNKLTLKLDKQIQGQIGTISEDDIAAYFNAHQEEFTTPDIYKMAIIEDEEADLNKLWVDVVVNGTSVKEAAEKRLGELPVVRLYPANHLDDAVLEKVTSMSAGDVSRAFPFKDGFSIIYLASYTPSKVVGLEEVKKEIRDKISRERYQKLKKEYIEDLRKNASIQINDKAWTQIKAELIQTQ